MEGATLAVTCPQILPETKKFETSSISLFSPIIHPHPVGATLNNLGNTCFMNAVLQCITHTVPFVEKLYANKHSQECPATEGDFCSFCALRRHVNESIIKSGLVITPRYLAYNLSKISSYFLPGEQQDAHEFLTCFLDSIHTSYSKPFSKVDDPLSYRGASPVNEVFGGSLKSQLRCLACGHSSDTYESIVDLSLEIDDVDYLTSALESFTRVETIDDPDIKVTCEGCKAQVSMEKQLKIEQPPNVLALHLKRFQNTESQTLKLLKFVKYPMELDLMPFLSYPREHEHSIYDLYAIVVHSGSCYYGHYCCYIRTSPTAWYQMNDSTMDVISEIDVLDLEAYILFYIKRDSSPWFSSFLVSQKVAHSESFLTDGIQVGDVESDTFTNMIDKVSAWDSPCREILIQPAREPAKEEPDKEELAKEPDKDPSSDNHISHECNQKSLVAEDRKKKMPLVSQNHVGPKGSSKQTAKAIMHSVQNEDKSLARIMKGMPNSRRMSLLACLQSSPEPSSKPSFTSKSDQSLKRRQRISSESPHRRSNKSKSISPRSIRRVLIEDDMDVSFEMLC